MGARDKSILLGMLKDIGAAAMPAGESLRFERQLDEFANRTGITIAPGLHEADREARRIMALIDLPPITTHKRRPRRARQ